MEPTSHHVLYAVYNSDPRAFACGLLVVQHSLMNRAILSSSSRYCFPSWRMIAGVASPSRCQVKQPRTTTPEYLMLPALRYPIRRRLSSARAPPVDHLQT